MESYIVNLHDQLAGQLVVIRSEAPRATGIRDSREGRVVKIADGSDSSALGFTFERHFRYQLAEVT